MKNADFARELAVLRAEGRDQIVVCGTETHICVMQTVADLLAEDASVFLVNDAVGSRNPDNRQAGIARMANLGAHCVTSEMVLFEWLEVAGSDDLKVISKLII
jgi:nicotinamidase-related amidase